MLSLLILPALAASLAAANPIFDERAACKQDNCLRGILQTSSIYKPSLSVRLADCSSFMTKTVTPDVQTITVTNTATTSTTTTLGQAALNRRSAVTKFASQPTYATWCVDTVAYSSGCSCAGITAATITVPTPSTTVTASATSTYTSTATPTPQGFYIQAVSANSDVNGQCAYIDVASSIGPNLGYKLDFLGSSSTLLPPSLFTLDDRGYLYSAGFQITSYAYCGGPCSSATLYAFPQAEAAAQPDDLTPLICSQVNTTLSCSFTLTPDFGPSYTLSAQLLGGQGVGAPSYLYLGSRNFGPPYNVSYTITTDITQCRSAPTSKTPTTVTPSAALPTPFYLQYVSSAVYNGQCAFLRTSTQENHYNALSILGASNQCGTAIPQFILDTNGYLTTTDLFQLGAYTTGCSGSLVNCSPVRYVQGVQTSNIPFYQGNWYPFTCSYDAGTSLLTCAFTSPAGSYSTVAASDSSGIYELNFGQNSGASSYTFRVLNSPITCSGSCLN